MQTLQWVCQTNTHVHTYELGRTSAPGNPVRPVSPGVPSTPGTPAGPYTPTVERGLDRPWQL